MKEFAQPVDVTTSAELDRLATQVEESRQPVPLTRGGRVVAVLRPAPRRARARRPPTRGKPIPQTDSIFKIIGIGRSDGPTDVSENVDHYLAEAYYEEFHPRAES